MQAHGKTNTQYQCSQLLWIVSIDMGGMETLLQDSSNFSENFCVRRVHCWQRKCQRLNLMKQDLAQMIRR